MSWFSELDKWVGDYLPDMQMLADEPLSRHSSFRIGGAARRFALPADSQQLILLENFAEECGARPLVIGNGTNVLFPDEGLDRLVISTRDMANVSRTENACEVVADAGASLAKVAVFACRESLGGLAFAHGIPGTVGGAMCMNAGAYGGEMKDVVKTVTILFPQEGVRVLSCEEMAFGYRRSILNDHPDGIVLSAVFCLHPGNSDEICAEMDALMEKRRASQPLELPSAGSTFKRPEGHFAGTLIQETGCKGLQVGGAQVSAKHAGFVVNAGGATAEDVRALIAQVQKRVFDATGVALEPEVKIIEG